jgi:hypothetical protein
LGGESGTPALLLQSTANVEDDTTDTIDAAATASHQAVELLALAESDQYLDVPDLNQTSISVTDQERHNRPQQELTQFLDEYDEFDNYFQVVDEFNERNPRGSNTLEPHHLRTEHDSSLDDFGLKANSRAETNPVSDPLFNKHVY